MTGHSYVSSQFSGIDYFIVTTNTNITSATVIADGKTNFDKMIEVINIHGQPVLESSVSGSGPYTFKFATEHKGAVKASDIQNSFTLHSGVFTFAGNTTVTQATGL